jgi:hypothetical protein
MTDTNNLIKNVAIDIMCITTMWGLLNNPYVAINNKCNTLPIYMTPLVSVVSVFVIAKYL